MCHWFKLSVLAVIFGTTDILFNSLGRAMELLSCLMWTTL